MGFLASGETLVNTTTTGIQRTAAVARMADGGYVVTWDDQSQTGADLSFTAVRGQIFNANGTKNGGEFLVNTTTADDQFNSSVTALADGRFIVTWTDLSQSGGDASGYAVRGQIFNANGTKSGGEFLVNTTTTSNQYDSSVTALADGRFVVTWRDLSQSGGDTSETAVRGQIFNANGTKSGGEFLVNTTTASFQFLSSVTALADGRFVVTWTDNSGSGGDVSTYAVRGQIFNANGTKSGGEFLVNTTTAGEQFDSSVTALADGRFVVTWTDNSQSGGDVSTYAVRAQVFSATGEKSGPEFLVNVTTQDLQSISSVAALDGGRFVVAWTDKSETGGDTSSDAIRSRVFDASYYGDADGIDDTVIGGSGGDEFHGGDGFDSLRGEGGNDELYGDAGNDALDGGAGDDFLVGGAGVDIILGGAGNDLIYGGDGTEETMHGDGGNDILHSGGEGHYYGDAGDDLIYAGLSNGIIDEVLDGGSGIDTLDTTSFVGAYVVNLTTGVTGFDYESFINFENIVTGNGDDTIKGTSAANIIITGGGADTVSAGNGNDKLDGGAEGDQMFGEAGSDTYVVDNAGDIVDESIAGSDGNDTVQSSISFNLGNAATVKGSVENLLLLGAANINGTGNGLSNLLIGNTGTNVLNGGAGIDTMRGMAGNDVYVVDNAGDIVDESIAGSNGSDIVQSSVSFNLANAVTVKGSVENLLLLGAANIHATGNGLGNLLIGNSGINILNGGAGIDTMRGMAGSDVYIVDNAGDIVDESIAGSSGNDIVQSSISFNLANTLGSVENLLLLGAANINGTGNGLSNLLIGNTGTNVLNGGAATDTMRGMAGSDVYVIDNAGDIVDESIAGSDGNDIVQSSISFDLGNAATVKGSVETLVLLGAANINGTGNGLNNLLVGNVGINILNGWTGNDTMRGMAGNDTYVVHNAGDIVDESIAGSAGNDTVQSYLSFNLANAVTVKGNVENLLLLGSAQINATGNGLSNSLTGNAGNNLINGAGGNDILTGAGGGDVFFFNTALNAATNVDIITDFSVPADTITLDNAIFTALGAVGTLAASAFHIGAAAADAADRVIYNNVTGALIYDSNGSAAGGATQFATLDTGLAMTNADFFIA